MPWLHLPGPAGRRQAWPRPVRNVQKNNGVSALARAGRPKTGLAPASAQPTRCNNMPWLHLPGPAVRRQAWPRPVRNMQKSVTGQGQPSEDRPGPGQCATNKMQQHAMVALARASRPKTGLAPASAQHAKQQWSQCTGQGQPSEDRPGPGRATNKTQQHAMVALARAGRLKTGLAPASAPHAKNNGVSALARAGRPKTGLAPASAQHQQDATEDMPCPDQCATCNYNAPRRSSPLFKTLPRSASRCRGASSNQSIGSSNSAWISSASR